MPADTIFPEWFQSLMLLAMIGLIILLAVKQANELKQLRNQAGRKPKIYTVEVCGDKETTREFREGDYVGAPVECEEGQGRITMIYAVYPEPEKGKKSR